MLWNKRVAIKENKKNQFKQPLIDHINDLRKALVMIMIAVIIGTIISQIYFLETLMDVIIIPIKDLAISMVYISATESLAIEIKLSALTGFVLTLPITYCVIWHFISPALYTKEKWRGIIYIIIATILFAGGVLFCFYIILPFTFEFLLTASSMELEAMLTINNYVKFVCRMVLCFGLIFEIPIVVFVLIKLSIVSIEKMRKFRKIYFVITLIFAAIITPPDIVSQLLVAIPMSVTYEMGIVVSSLYFFIARIKNKHRVRRKKDGKGKENTTIKT